MNIQNWKIGNHKRFIFIASLIFIGTGCGSLWSQIPSDESGTLVMVARTASEVIVSVDSKIKPHNPNLPPSAIPVTPVDGDRKLVNVGKHSACALDGNVGSNEGSLDVSASMRLWIDENPKMEAQEAIDALLDAAAGAWDRHNFTLADIAIQYPTRKIGSTITKITCGEFIDGHPIIVVGETYVKADDLSGQVADKRTFPQEEKTVLYMGGEYPDAHYFTALIDEPVLLLQIDRLLPSGKDKAVREDIRANATAMAAFDKWKIAPSTWTQTDVRDLFVPTFSSVEKYSSDVVGMPNNVRILTACGRLETTVEDDWPTCPPSSTPVTKKQKSSSKGKSRPST